MGLAIVLEARAAQAIAAATSAGIAEALAEGIVVASAAVVRSALEAGTCRAEAAGVQVLLAGAVEDTADQVHGPRVAGAPPVWEAAVVVVVGGGEGIRNDEEHRDEIDRCE